MGRGRLIKALAGETARDAPMADTTLPHPTRSVTEAAGSRKPSRGWRSSPPAHALKTIIADALQEDLDRRRPQLRG